MLLSEYNFEYPGMGVALFSAIIFAMLLFWNIYHKSSSGLNKTIYGFLIAGIIYGIFSAAFYLTEGLDPLFYENIGASYDLMLLNMSNLVMVMFNVIYVKKKTMRSVKEGTIPMYFVYISATLLMILFVLNAVITSTGGKPLYNALGPEGMIYNKTIYQLSLNLIIAVTFVPFIFIFKAWKRCLPKERVILFVFAIFPLFTYLFTLLVYNGAEMNVTFANYSVLGILMVIFDQIQLDDKHEKQRAIAERLAYDAMHDKVTGLVTPEIFKQQIAEFLSDNGSQSCCLAVIDIDNFKEINSIYGRQFGDEVLKAAAKLLNEVVRYDDIAGRIGADEFGVFFKCDVRYFDAIIARIRDSLDFNFDGVDVSACIGTARVTDNDSDYEYLFALADRALTQAKREGPASYRLVSK